MSRPRYNWACPTCEAAAGEPCRTTFLAMHPGRVTDTHQARLGWVGIFENRDEEKQ
jgi:hypothetical protein